MRFVLLFLVFPVAETFFLKKKSDGRPYAVLNPRGAVTADGPVVYILKCRSAGVGSNPGYCIFEF
jgi:hypothetical protein